MSRISRRDFIATLSALGLSPAAFALDRGQKPDTESIATFAHGVASGDPLQDRVILWTRITPRRFADEVEGKWHIATDERMKHVCNGGRFSTDITRDFTIKIDADGLDPDRT